MTTPPPSAIPTPSKRDRGETLVQDITLGPVVLSVDGITAQPSGTAVKLKPLTRVDSMDKQMAIGGPTTIAAFESGTQTVKLCFDEDGKTFEPVSVMLDLSVHAL